MARKIRVTQIRGGKKISFLTKDKGKVGKTPKAQRWNGDVLETKTGWRKDMPMVKRRSLVLKAHGNDYLASGRAMQALANLSADKETSRKAGADAKYFFREYAKRKR